MRKKILIVEDHDDIRDMMVIFVDEIGYEPLGASDGHEGLEMALKHTPDLILMDIAMPVMDGLEAAAVLRSHDQLAHIPIIAVTSHGSSVPEHIKTGQFDQVIDKPVDIYSLKPILDRFLNRSNDASVA
jgi:CheY-like chemotaxis protein